MKLESNAFILLPILTVAILGSFGCGSMDIQEETVQMTNKISKPSVIYVKPFEPGDDWNGDFENKTKDVFIKEKMQDLTNDLVKYLSEIVPAHVAPTPLPSQGLLVTGSLSHVEAGSGAVRYFGGLLGQGTREVTGNVQIYDLAKSSTVPIASFKIEGGSGLNSGIMGAVEGIGTEWDRIGKETRDFILRQIQ